MLQYIIVKCLNIA